MTEYADEEFWKKYEEYVEESLPRHKKAIDALLKFADDDLSLKESSLLDLGCGGSKEAEKLFEPAFYYGLDKDPKHSSYNRSFDCGLDYRVHWDDFLHSAKDFNVVCSLFSSEITAPWPENYDLYDRIFSDLEKVKYIFLAGFYYTDKMDQNPVEEPGGIQSYQTLEPMYAASDAIFEEHRLYVHAPSTLFGPNVVEVWKMLKRKEM